jgi:hypothetical protein
VEYRYLSTPFAPDHIKGICRIPSESFVLRTNPSLISRKEEYDKKFKDILEEKRTYLKTIEGIVGRVNMMWFSLEAN